MAQFKNMSDQELALFMQSYTANMSSTYEQNLNYKKRGVTTKNVTFFIF